MGVLRSCDGEGKLLVGVEDQSRDSGRYVEAKLRETDGGSWSLEIKKKKKEQQEA